jgi:hypothetical protein
MSVHLPLHLNLLHGSISFIYKHAQHSLFAVAGSQSTDGDKLLTALTMIACICLSA